MTAYEKALVSAIVDATPLANDIGVIIAQYAATPVTAQIKTCLSFYSAFKKGDATVKNNLCTLLKENIYAFTGDDFKRVNESADEISIEFSPPYSPYCTSYSRYTLTLRENQGELIETRVLDNDDNFSSTIWDALTFDDCQIKTKENPAIKGGILWKAAKILTIPTEPIPELDNAREEEIYALTAKFGTPKERLMTLCKHYPQEYSLLKTLEPYLVNSKNGEYPYLSINKAMTINANTARILASAYTVINADAQARDRLTVDVLIRAIKREQDVFLQHGFTLDDLQRIKQNRPGEQALDLEAVDLPEDMPEPIPTTENLQRPMTKLIAKWPPKLEGADDAHVYWDAAGHKIAHTQTGASLPSKAFVEHAQLQSKEKKRPSLDSVKLFTNLPTTFFQKYLDIQTGATPFDLPKIAQNKNVTLRSCFNKHAAFASEAGELHPSHWQALGWDSQEAYEDWLDSSMLFAFSHCHHYCSALRIFDVDKNRMANEAGSAFHFKEYTAAEIQDKPRRTNIYSVTGFEFRNFKEQGEDTVEAMLPGVQAHSTISMQQILAAAQDTNTTDIVLIPFGMGVFIKNHPKEAEIRAAMMKGLVDGLKTYKGPAVTIHYCGPETLYAQLNQEQYPNIKLIHQANTDAYTLANDIQDRGDDHHEMTTDESPRVLKSMLINAGDNDWTAVLDKTREPGQCYQGHTLYDQTSDERFALLSDFSFHSIQNVKESFDGFPLENIKHCQAAKPSLAPAPIQASFLIELLSHPGMSVFSTALVIAGICTMAAATGLGWILLGAATSLVGLGLLTAGFFARRANMPPEATPPDPDLGLGR